MKQAGKPVQSWQFLRCLMKSLSKFSAVFTLAFVLVLSSANLDNATARDLESRTQAVDRFADWFFYKVCSLLSLCESNADPEEEPPFFWQLTGERTVGAA